ncbi:hypothetical protein [Silvanigrella aquatica]|uniref:Uncharacterized protein n=1 Tax=Silvanigrella aquatica TaxID=1915309 RepID=A0A1L4CZ91_9BACT|nr:hypothetical protein [Silvanigrella aquatica]APJ03257.1 hypothetical protein AXG55_04805 [Silvanigrella aquatica]
MFYFKIKNQFFCYFIFLTILIFQEKNSFAWKNHSIITTYSLQDSHYFDSFKNIRAEKLEDFLRQSTTNLPKVLASVEQWAINRSENFDFTYPKTPENLKFKSSSNDPKIVEKFLNAIRVNSSVKFPLYLQILPGDFPQNFDTILQKEEVMLHSIMNDMGEYIFIKINEQDFVDPLKVVATASDEPDYGMDINLFKDNPKDFNENYAFGQQPFGNAQFSFNSQAPFHMGFYHLSPLIYKTAPYLKQTYAEYRIKLFTEMSRFAFQTGHPYWGLRFLGWSLHYIQDLTQPFHNSPIPGYSTADLISLNILDKIQDAFCKSHTKINDSINVITNRHLILEKYIYDKLVYSIKNNFIQSPIILALNNSSFDHKYPKYDENYVRNIITQEASQEENPTYGSYIFWLLNKDTSAIIGRSFPSEYTFDPKYIYNDNFDSLTILNQQSENKKIEMLTIENKLMLRAGSHTRKLIEYIL